MNTQAGTTGRACAMALVLAFGWGRAEPFRTKQRPRELFAKTAQANSVKSRLAKPCPRAYGFPTWAIGEPV